MASRLFFALLPDAATCAVLDGAAAAMAQATGGRQTRSENLHLTLVFVGDVASERVPELVAAGAASAAAATPFRLTLDEWGTFGRSGIAWLGATQVPAPLAALVATLSRYLIGAGCTLEQRLFRAHVTLARRCDRRVAPATLGPIAVDWEVDRFALMASELRPEGPRYRCVAAWQLGAGTG